MKKLRSNSSSQNIRNFPNTPNMEVLEPRLLGINLVPALSGDSGYFSKWRLGTRLPYFLK